MSEDKIINLKFPSGNFRVEYGQVKQKVYIVMEIYGDFDGAWQDPMGVFSDESYAKEYSAKLLAEKELDEYYGDNYGYEILEFTLDVEQGKTDEKDT